MFPATSPGRQWLIVGLGNPGPSYVRTRHNAGAWVLDRLRREWDLPDWKRHTTVNALTTRGQVLEPPGGTVSRRSTPRVILVRPQTFMNASGSAVASLLRTRRIPVDRLLIIHDDKDIRFGDIQLQRNRSSAGHTGVQSIIEALGMKDFWRLRIGIGAEAQNEPTEKFVLQPFTDAEHMQLARDVVPAAQEHLQHLLTRPPT